MSYICWSILNYGKLKNKGPTCIYGVHSLFPTLLNYFPIVTSLCSTPKDVAFRKLLWCHKSNFFKNNANKKNKNADKTLPVVIKYRYLRNFSLQIVGNFWPYRWGIFYAV